MRILFLCFAMLFCTIVNSQEVELEKNIITQEVDKAVLFLAQLDEDTRKYIRFFSTYNLPDDFNVNITGFDQAKKEKIPFKEGVVKALDYTIHSLSYEDIYNPVQPVLDSKTLYWIDVRNYGWTPEAFDIVSAAEPYFREPWVEFESAVAAYVLSEKDKNNNTRALPIVRADWFIVHTLDPTKQTDINPSAVPFYYTLTYSTVGIPKNVDEFAQKWFVDKDKIEKRLRTVTNCVVKKGTSGVSRNNRFLARTRTELGYWYETSDVKSNLGNNDFAENIKPRILGRGERDATEIITSNKVGLQVYFLADGKGNRVEFADPTIVTNRKEVVDSRVKTGRSCMDCHAGGLNQANNYIKELINSKIINLKTFDADFQRDIRASLLKDFNRYINEDSELYKDAVFAVNGLNPIGNGELLKEVFKWYEADVYLEQAARECGVDVLTFKDYVSDGTGANIAGLFDEKPTPRDNWEDPKFGVFAQAITLIIREKAYECIINKEGTEIKVGTKTIGTGKVGESHLVLGNTNGWIKIDYNGQIAYIQPKDVDIKEKE